MSLERLTGPRYPNSHIAAANLQANRDALQKLTGKPAEYTPPSPGHYWNPYLWDEILHDTIDARNGTPDSLTAAQKGFKTLLRGQEEDGFIPNMRIVAKRRLIEPERWFCFENDDRSNYTQPPILAMGASEIYLALLNDENKAPLERADRADEFLHGVYPGLKRFYEYFDKHRRVAPDDRRMFIIHPHETGRDHDPTYDYLKPNRLQRRGQETSLFVDKANLVLNYFQIIRFGNKLKHTNGNMQAARELFGAVDVMMNCLLVDNLDEMAVLARSAGSPEDELYFLQYARDVETKILTEMWDPDKGDFYAQDNSGKPIKEVTVSNLFPLLLPNIRPEQLEGILSRAQHSFNAMYTLPSVATDSINYDPGYREKSIWRGPVWPNINWLLHERGLNKQTARAELMDQPELIERCNRWAMLIRFDARRLLHRNGPWEFYDPDTGKGMRVGNFGWSNLGHVM